MVVNPEDVIAKPERRAENLTRLTEKVRQLHYPTAERRTADDLVQVQYAVAQRQVEDALRGALDDWKRLSAAHLGVAPDDMVLLVEKPAGTHVMPLLRLIGEQLVSHPDVEIGGANPTYMPEWQRVDIAGVVESIPNSMTIYWDPGTVAEVPLVLGTWTDNRGQRAFVVRSSAKDQAQARAYLERLLSDARGPANPYRGRLLKAAAAMGGVGFDILADPTDTRQSLIFPPEIWDALDFNVHRMFDRMDLFRAAGLGSNRGVLLAGAPGTGKTAACRVLAQEVIGVATPIFVEAKVGQYLLRQLYEQLEGLGPVLVLIEDLDLLVGDREEHTARDAVFDFLTVLDGLMTQHRDVVTVATTNEPEAIDAAVRRAARFDQMVTFPLPDAEARERILRVYLGSIDHRVDAGVVAGATEGCTGADLREQVRGALLRAEGPLATQDLLAMIAPSDAGVRSGATDAHRPGGRYL